MADKTIVTTLEVAGGDQVISTMKDLKKQISDYRDELVRLGQIENKTEAQMDRQAHVIDKLRDATKLLSDVTNAHKKSIDGEAKSIDIATASYNDLQKELTRLKKAYKEMTAMERDSPVGEDTLKQISKLDVKLKDLDAGMGVYNRNVGNYGQTFEQSMAKAKESAGFLEQGMGSLLGVIALTGTENQGLIKTITALQLAFQVFGNEGVQKVIIKMKDWVASKMAAKGASTAMATATKGAAAAMTAEAAATKGATTATKTFTKALIATGIGAIVAAVGALITYWEEFTELLGLSSSEGEKAIKKLEEAIEDLQVAQERSIELLKARGATQYEVFSKELAMAGDLVLKYEELADAVISQELDAFFSDVDRVREAMERAAESEQNMLDKANTAYAAVISVLTTSQQAYDTRNMTEYEKGVSQLNLEYNQMKNLLGEIFLLDTSRQIMGAADYQQRLADLREWKEREQQLLDEAEKKRQEQEAAARRRAAAAEAKRRADQAKREREQAEREREKARKEEMDAEMQAFADEEEWLRAEQEAHYNAVMEEIELEKERKRAIQEERDGVVEAIHEETMARLEAQMEEEALLEEQKERNKERVKSYIDASAQGLGAISGLLSSIGEIVESQGKDELKAAKHSKNIQIATTTIDTITGATQAYMSAQSLPFPMGPILGAINAAAVLATGIANITKIKNTPISKTSSSGSASASTGSAAVSAPNIQTQLPMTTTITGASEEERLNKLAEKQKVYILQSDIEAAGKASKVQVAESSF